MCGLGDTKGTEFESVTEQNQQMLYNSSEVHNLHRPPFAVRLVRA